MKYLVILLLVFGACALANGSDFLSAEGAPHLIVSSVDGRLESGKEGTLLIELQNAGIVSINQTTEPVEGQEILVDLERGYEMKSSEAIGIKGELLSGDDRISVLSVPQLGGSLASGEVLPIPLEFVLKVDEAAGTGVYPLELVVTYERQSNVEVEGDPHFPEFFFQYETLSESIPLEISVTKGISLAIDKIEGVAAPGKESSIKVIVANFGDEHALDIQMQPISKPPFTSVGVKDLGTLKPGDSASAKFKIYTDTNTTSGEYAFCFDASYLVEEEKRHVELVGLVEVGKPAGFRTIYLIPLIALLLIGLYVGGAGRYLNKKLRRRRW